MSERPKEDEVERQVETVAALMLRNTARMSSLQQLSKNLVACCREMILLSEAVHKAALKIDIETDLLYGLGTALNLKHTEMILKRELP